MDTTIPKFKSFIFRNINKSLEDLLLEIDTLSSSTSNNYIINSERQSILYEIYTSNKLEGNTVTFQDTKFILEDNINVDCPVKELLEITNLNTAIKRYNSFNELSVELILDIHKTITSSILTEDNCGKIRTEDVFIVGSIHYPPKPILVKDLLSKEIEAFNTSNKTLYDIFIFTYKFTLIHPFIDGNGRSSRVIMNALLSHYNYPRLTIDDTCKKFYYKALEEASVQYKESNWIRFCYLRLLFSLQYGLVIE